MAKKPLLTAEEEQDLGRRARAGDVAARKELVLRNTGYVKKMASRFAYFCSDEDLLQEMYLGLMEAVDKFDPERKCKFLTIAQHYVKKYALLYLSKRHIVFVPALMRKAAPTTKAKGTRARSRFEQAATAAEIALRRPIYLGAYPDNGDEIIGAEREQNNLARDTETLHEAIRQLTPMEAAVIRGRFGIDGCAETGKAMAARFRCHPQKIVNIKHTAIGKLHRLIGNEARG